MSQNTHESLSALMDGESDELELRRVLKGLDDDSDAADTWRRYHLARSLMQRDREIDVSMDLSAGIMARIQEESPEQVAAPAETTPRQKVSSMSFARGAGIAAAVSLMVITGVQYFNSGTDPIEQPSNNVANNATQPVQQVQPVNLSSFSTSNPMLSDTPTDVPMFEQMPFRLSGDGTAGNGLMTVSEGNLAMPSAQPSSNMNIQSFAMDSEQLRLLKSYFEEHGQYDADSWSASASSAASE
ncbi:sigma-E factor negative regulatory protein [Halomonas sp. CH40]